MMTLSFLLTIPTVMAAQAQQTNGAATEPSFLDAALSENDKYGAVPREFYMHFEEFKAAVGRRDSASVLERIADPLAWRNGRVMYFEPQLHPDHLQEIVDGSWTSYSRTELGVLREVQVNGPEPLEQYKWEELLGQTCVMSCYGVDIQNRKFTFKSGGSNRVVGIWREGPQVTILLFVKGAANWELHKVLEVVAVDT